MAEEAVICELVSARRFPWYQGKLQGIGSIMALILYLRVTLRR